MNYILRLMPQEIRLYTEETLEQSVPITLLVQQSHYLINVMRCKAGDFISVFNGRDGQWQAEITSMNKKSVTAVPLTQTREQNYSPDLWLVFSLIKNKSEMVVEKATELGVSKIIPLVTRHSVVRSVNMEKLKAHAIEAAEQCERLDVPAIETSKDLSYLLGQWDENRILLYGDEVGGGVPLPEFLETADSNKKYAVLIGPEGGFAEDEFRMLRMCDFAKGFGMGSRILRADTAAVSALACVQAQLGDWDKKPRFISVDKL